MKLKNKNGGGPKVLLLDIESAPVLGYVWQLWDNNVALNQINKDWHLLSWAAKWLNSDTIMYADQRNADDIENDKKLLGGIHKLLNEADIVVTQNGVSFDIKKLNARFIINGYPPPSPYKQIDTKLIAQKHFGFTSNKLEYMAGKFSNSKKDDHKKFPGFELWKACLAGNRDAWDEMKKYNIQDVIALEEVYKKLAPWQSTGINFSLYYEDNKHHCQCGSTDVERRGYSYTDAGKYRRYRCRNCGHWSRSAVNLLTPEKRLNIKRGHPK